MLIFKKLSRYLGMHLESRFGPEQMEQNAIYNITLFSANPLISSAFLNQHYRSTYKRTGITCYLNKNPSSVIGPGSSSQAAYSAGNPIRFDFKET